VLRVLLQLYRDSFGCEFNKEGDYDNFDLMVKTSKKEYINFCMMYNIFPFYITKGMAIGLWGEIINLDLEWIQSQLVNQICLNSGWRCRIPRLWICLYI